MKKSEIDLKLLTDCLKTFEESLDPKNLLERDGAIQRFEFTFELSWKTLARVLQADRPLEDNSVKGVLREGARRNLLDDLDKWFEFQTARNLTSHTYDQKIAEQVFLVAKKLPPYVHKLISKLSKNLGT